MSQYYDVIVIGAGPGGSTLATLLARKNYKVAIFEREEFPRFKIGESLLPHSMDILKESGVFDTINSGKYIKKYGASFLDYREEEPICFDFAKGLDSDHEYAFEVPREEFDKDLLDHARSCGVAVFQPCGVQSVDLAQNPVEIRTKDGSAFSCRYMVDASGRSAFLGSCFQSRNKNDHFINNVAIFNHYKGVKRDLQKREGDIIIGILPEQSWSWHIPFKGEVTSVGVVCSPQNFKNQKESDDLIKDLLQCHPRFVDLMESAEPLREQSIVSNYSYSSSQKIGDNWLMLGDAATFLDPVFSSGVHISLRSASMAAKVLDQALSNKLSLLSTEKGSTYSQDLQKGVDRFQSLLLLFYKTAFIDHMKKIIQTDFLYRSFTSVFGGDMWNDDNCLFRLGILKDGKLPDEKYLI